MTVEAANKPIINNGLDVLVERRRRKLRQWQLAQMLGVNPVRLSQIETENASLTSAMAQRIRAALAAYDKAVRA